MQTNRVALVTTRAARRLDEDLAPLEAALRGLGADAEAVDWDDATADWSAYDIALLRSPWDYSKRLPEFLAWTERVSGLTTLLNPSPVVRWNADKHYLVELMHAGVPVVPSHFTERGEDAATGLQRFFALQGDDADFVVKPAAGAGSRDVQRFVRADVEAATVHAQRVLDSGRAVLLQPYLHLIDAHGETALFYFAGEFSHAIRKGALLRRGAPPVRALFNKEYISVREPEPEELRVAASALQAQPFGTLLHARVDLIRDAAGMPRLLELELTGPTMFLASSPGSADRYAAAILEAARQRGR